MHTLYKVALFQYTIHILYLLISVFIYLQAVTSYSPASGEAIARVTEVHTFNCCHFCNRKLYLLKEDSNVMLELISQYIYHTK